MSHHANKFILLLLLLMVTSCLSEAEKLERARQRLQEAKPELLQIREDLLDFSTNFIGEKEYWEIYDNINDSIDLWANNDLGFYQYMKRDGSQTLDYMVDSILCFNMYKDKFITALLLRCLNKDAVQDDIWYFYGVKIKGKWYFFDGATIVLPREYYQEDIRTPLSFETLKLLSTKHIFRNYLKSDWFGNVEINDNFFKGFAPKNQVSPGYGSCPTCETEDEYFLHLVNLNWSERDKR